MSSKKIIAPDLPQAILDELNRVDFKQIGIKKPFIMGALRNYASTLPQKTAGKNYPKGAAKKISADFDQDMLNLLNLYDWALVPQAKVQEMVQLCRQYIGGMIPAKKGK